MLWQLDRHLQKDEPGTVLLKNQLKINYIPKCNSDTIKLLEKNGKFCDYLIGNVFLDTS